MAWSKLILGTVWDNDDLQGLRDWSQNEVSLFLTKGCHMCYLGHSDDSLMTSAYLFLSSESDQGRNFTPLFLLYFISKPSMEGKERSHKETHGVR